VAMLLTNLNRFSIFFAGRFLGKFAVKVIVKNPTIGYLGYVATLTCETLISEKIDY